MLSADIRKKLDKARARSKAYYLENKEKVLAKQKQWRLKNKKQISFKNKAYRISNRIKLNATAKKRDNEWRRDNPILAKIQDNQDYEKRKVALKVKRDLKNNLPKVQHTITKPPKIATDVKTAFANEVTNREQAIRELRERNNKALLEAKQHRQLQREKAYESYRR